MFEHISIKTIICKKHVYKFFLKYFRRSKVFVVKKIIVLDDVLESEYSCETPTRFGLLAQMASRSPFASI